MRLSFLLFVMHFIIKRASKKNDAFKKYIKNMRIKILVRTADGKRGRMFVFDRGLVSSKRGNHDDYDAALVWSDPGTAFRVMTSGSDDETFRAASEGKFFVEGMSYYAQWFRDGMKLVI
jgi:hypothetical protein